MDIYKLLSAAADYGFPMLVSSYLLIRMEGRIERLSANIEKPIARTARKASHAVPVYPKPHIKQKPRFLHLVKIRAIFILHPPGAPPEAPRESFPARAKAGCRRAQYASCQSPLP